MSHVQSHSGKLSVVTGASTGIGFELAKHCVQDGMDVLLVADEPQIADAASQLQAFGSGRLTPLEADLSTVEGVDRLLAAVGDRPIEHLIANAGRGMGHAFVDQDWGDVLHVLNTNVTGTLYLLHRLLPRMVAAGHGRVLITGSIAGYMPGSYSAVYNGTKAFLDSFAFAIRDELKDTGVSVTCLMPGATDTHFFERADMLDTKVATEKKMDPADVARQGYDAMLAGEGNVITGWQNKMQVAMASVLPGEHSARKYAEEAAPGTAKS